MDNFHYKNLAGAPKSEKSAKLLEQLQAIDRQLADDNRKLAEKKRLEQEFYEDANKLNLADEIMNELLGQKPSRPAPIAQLPRYDRAPLSPAPGLKPTQNFHEQNLRFAQQERIPRQPQASKVFVNQRELQKQKLQNRNAQEDFPFGSREKQRKRTREMENPTRQSPEREPALRNNYMGAMPASKNSEKIQNPFIKNDQLYKQKREQQERNYRRLLEQQMQQQRRRKQQQKLKYKQQLQENFNSYTPLLAANTPSPVNDQKPADNMAYRKKRDPNAQHMPIEKPVTQIRKSDLDYMKHQVDDLRHKLKKGRINYEEYEVQVKKLEGHYKCKIDDVYPEDTGSKSNQPNRQRPEAELEKQLEEAMKPVMTPQQLQPEPFVGRNRSQLSSGVQGPTNPYINQSVPLQYMGPRQQPMPVASHYYPQPVPMMPVAPQSDYQMQMMLKLFDQLKGIIKMQSQNQMSILNDKRVLQQTLSKMGPYMMPQTVNPIMLTQQIPVNAMPAPQKQFQTEAKKVQKFESFARQHFHDVGQPSGDSEISSSYIQKSMSGIVNKIPLTKKQKEEDVGDSGRDISKFYQRKYKVKKFKGFEYTEAENNSIVVIPSVSNFLQSKNAENELHQAFERDLKKYKKLEKQRDILVLKQKLNKDKQTNQQARKQSKSNEANKQAPIKVNKYNSLNVQAQQPKNPFLKKHISNESKAENNSIDPVQYQGQAINSPQAKNTQILQQQQYQTEPRKSQSPRTYRRQQAPKAEKVDQRKQQEMTGKFKDPSVKQKQQASSRILNIMKTNNEILSKYEMTPSRYEQSNIASGSMSSIKEAVRADESKDMSSREYFSSHDISPVQRREYESSLETVRSEQQSAKIERKSNMQYLMANSGSYRYSNQLRSPLQSPPTIESISSEKMLSPRENQRYRENQPNITGYSQTVESIEQSSSRLPSFNKPPSNNPRKNRSSSRKKQSVVRVNSSNLSGIQSQGSREKGSSIEKNPSSSIGVSKMQAPQFDSNVYESAYEQSERTRQGDNPSYKFPKLHSQQQLQPASFKQVLMAPPSQEQPRKMTKKVGEQAKFQTQARESGLSSNLPKLRSLEQARKLAKQFKQRANDDHNRSSVEQKLSELESFLHPSKKEESVLAGRSAVRDETTSKKKDILKMLDDLGDDDEYQADFDSYKEESER